jgi:hypothetical protein
MRDLLFGVHALLAGAAAQAGTVNEHYADAGPWRITTDNHQACMMQSYYVIKRNGDEQTLAVFYDAKRKGAVLGWGTRKPKLPPLSASFDFELTFTPKGKPKITSWGNQTFEIDKAADEYRYTHVFKGPDGDRLLRDLASSDTVALSLGPVLMMTLPLDASDAVTKLRECSSKLAERDTSSRLQK